MKCAANMIYSITILATNAVVKRSSQHTTMVPARAVVAAHSRKVAKVILRSPPAERQLWGSGSRRTTDKRVPFAKPNGTRLSSVIRNFALKFFGKAHHDAKTGI